MLGADAAEAVAVADVAWAAADAVWEVAASLAVA